MAARAMQVDFRGRSLARKRGRSRSRSRSVSRSRTPAPISGAAARVLSETKYVDGYYDDTDIHTFSGGADDTWADCEANPRQSTAVYGCLPVPRQGTNYADRDGRKIFLKKIIIKGMIHWEPSDSDTTPIRRSPVRIVVVQDTRTNGVGLSAEDVIGPGLGSDGTGTVSGNGNALALLTNPDGWGRYKIKFDKVFRVPPTPAWGDNTNAGNTLGMEIPFRIVVKCNCFVNFDASTGEVGSVIDNSFHLLAASNNTTIAPSLSYYARSAFLG